MAQLQSTGIGGMGGGVLTPNQRDHLSTCVTNNVQATMYGQQCIRNSFGAKSIGKG